MIQVNKLSKYYLTGNSWLSDGKKAIKAVDNVSFNISHGETLGLVGESGCGKSTLGRCIAQLEKPSSGSILMNGLDLTSLNEKNMRQMRRKIQIIFQDPYSSLNPRMTVFEAVNAPLKAFGIGTKKSREKKVTELLEYVGINQRQIHRYPHEFSGGQRQRVVIARAIILDPEFVICDEPVSALDVSVRSLVLNLMKDIQKDKGLTYLFISHDLSVIEHISNRIAVMYLGKIVEIAERDTLFNNPLHPYTIALMNAIPIPDPKRRSLNNVILGDVPNPTNPPKGCHFHTRCPHAKEICKTVEPEQRYIEENHMIACHVFGK